jgi:excinuclease ABC subunit A
MGRTPRSNLATYTGLFDHVRRLFGAAKSARARRTMPAGSRSTCRRGDAINCAGEGFVMVELLFLPSVYAPCPVYHGTRYNAKTLAITQRLRSSHSWCLLVGGKT